MIDEQALARSKEDKLSYCPICRTNSIKWYMTDFDPSPNTDEQPSVVGYTCENCGDVVRDIRE